MPSSSRRTSALSFHKRYIMTSPFAELHEDGNVVDPPFTAIPLQLSPYRPGQDAIDYLNDLEHRSYASTFLSVDKSLARIASTLRGVPEKHASLELRCDFPNARLNDRVFVDEPPVDRLIKLYDLGRATGNDIGDPKTPLVADTPFPKAITLE